MQTLLTVKTDRPVENRPIPSQSLEQHLLKSGLLNVDQLVVANNYRKSTGKNLSQILDTLGWVRQEIVDDLADRLCLFNGAV